MLLNDAAEAGRAYVTDVTNDTLPKAAATLAA